ncbi:hypothetical protein LZ30DRAFT_733825 [Colletotrichum cereale]|nr:hypothetical protein LZ30DRAFT_733825 [Colletotrichum cereale]
MRPSAMLPRKPFHMRQEFLAELLLISGILCRCLGLSSSYPVSSVSCKQGNQCWRYLDEKPHRNEGVYGQEGQDVDCLNR